MSRRELRRCRQRLLEAAGQAIARFDLIRAGDRVLVAVSAGKDSLTLLDFLLHLRQAAPIDFEMVAGHIDVSGAPSGSGLGTGDRMAAYFERLGVPHVVHRAPIQRLAEQISDPAKNPCALCARFKRAALYDLARDRGCTTVALGHHADDLIETVLLSMFFAGQIKSMPPKLRSDDDTLWLIRPLCLAWEAEIERYAREARLPVIPNPTCNERLDSRRRWLKQWLAETSRALPHLKGNLLHSLGKVVPSHLLAPAAPRSPAAGPHPTSPP